MTKIAVVFPGHGSQRVGMAEDFYNTYQECRDIFAQASDLLHIDVAKLCFTENDDIGKTECTQPALLTAEIGIYECLKKHFGLQATYFAGHSLGEYTALVAAGVMNFQEGINIAQGRGSLLDAAAPIGSGGMSALILEDIEKTNYRKIVADAGAEVANINSNKQVVISGKSEDIAKATTILAQEHPAMSIIPIDVQSPFHCSLMGIVEENFRDFLNLFKDHFDLSKASAVLSNYTGTFHKPEAVIEMMIKQISGPVQWVQNMQVLSEVASKIIEIGPMPVLRKFFSSNGIEAKTVMDIRTAKRVFGDGAAV